MEGADGFVFASKLNSRQFDRMCFFSGAARTSMSLSGLVPVHVSVLDVCFACE